MLRLPASSRLRAALCTVVLALVVAGCGSSKKSPAKATTSTPPAQVAGGHGQTVDGIPCEVNEQLTYHVHAHLLLLVNGVSAPLPALIGIPLAGGAAKCFYFLHTHDTTGVIHIEAAKPRTFTLGQFFAVWGQPLSSRRASSLTAPLHVFVGQRAFHGNPADIKLKAHELITIESGKLVKPPGYTFATGL